MEKESGRIREENWAGDNGSKWERLHEMAGQKENCLCFSQKCKKTVYDGRWEKMKKRMKSLTERFPQWWINPRNGLLWDIVWLFSFYYTQYQQNACLWSLTTFISLLFVLSMVHKAGQDSVYSHYVLNDFASNM